EVVPVEVDAAVAEVTFAPDGRTLAGACGDGTVRLYDAGARRELRRIVAHGRGATCVAFAPDGRSLASGSEAEGGVDDREPTGWLRVWDLESGREKMTLPAHP